MAETSGGRWGRLWWLGCGWWRRGRAHRLRVLWWISGTRMRTGGIRGSRGWAVMERTQRGRRFCGGGSRRSPSEAQSRAAQEHLTGLRWRSTIGVRPDNKKANMPRAAKTITFSLPLEIAERVDEAMRQQGRSRSEFLRETLLRCIEEVRVHPPCRDPQLGVEAARLRYATGGRRIGQVALYPGLSRRRHLIGESRVG